MPHVIKHVLELTRHKFPTFGHPISYCDLIFLQYFTEDQSFECLQTLSHCTCKKKSAPVRISTLMTAIARKPATMDDSEFYDSTERLISEISAHNNAIPKASKKILSQQLPVVVKNSEHVVADIAQTWALIQRLEKDKLEVSEMRWKFKGRTSHFKEFPPEILAEIFAHAISGEPVALPSQLQRFGDVCREWRVIALTTPALWDNVSITYDKKWDDLMPEWLQKIRECISKSEGLPLTMIISSCDSDKYHPITEFIIPLAHRLRRLHISAPRADILHFLTLPSNSFDTLGAIGVSQVDFGYIGTKEEYFSVLQNAHNLREATININRSSRRVLLPLAQLTRIGIKTVTPKEGCTVLRSCSALVECRLTILTSNSRVVEPSLVCQKIKVLHLDFVGRVNPADTFIQHLSLPSLTEIRVTSTYWSPVAQPKTIADLISRSVCSLNIMHISLEATEAILRLTPSLLNLEANFLAKPTLQNIGLGDLVPQLRVLKFTVIELAPVIDMLERRWSREKSKPRIHSVHLNCAGIADNEKVLLDSLDELITQGEGITVMFVKSILLSLRLCFADFDYRKPREEKEIDLLVFPRLRRQIIP